MPWLLEMSLLVSVILVALHIYIGWRLYRMLKPVKMPAWLSMVPFLALFSFYIHPLSGLVYHLIWGEPDMLTFSQPVAYWFWFGLVFSAQLVTWLIIADVMKWAVQYFSSLDRTEIAYWYRRAFAAIVLAVFIFTGVRMVHDTRSIQVERHSYVSSRVSSELNGLRIAHITDIQGDEYTGKAEISAYVNRINELNPDLVVFTGDLISYGTDFIAMAAKELGKAKSTYGTYAVIGDHDYWAGVSNIKENYDLQQVNLLQDENTIIPIRKDSILLTGITEVYSKHIPQDSLQLLTSEDMGMPVRVLATHQATEKVIEQAKQADYQLLLAGHTHGGQLKVPFMFKKFSAAEEDTPYLSGVYRFGDLMMNVDNGLGFTLAPVRYNAPPTISLIELQSVEVQ